MLRLNLLSALTVLLITSHGCQNADRRESMGDADSGVMTCRYQNPFSGVDECRQYYGDWTNQQFEDACAAVYAGTSGAISTEPCSDENAIGICTPAAGETGLVFKIWFYGGDPEISDRLCGEFLDGTWEDFGTGAPPAMAENTLMDDALEFLESTSNVDVGPACGDVTCLDELIENRQGIEFVPVGVAPTVGLIIYPGALVDPRAYATLGRAIAEQGVMAIIVPMPDLFALNGWDRANSIIEAHPEIQSWYLAGHSMGGAMTAHFAKMYPGVMKGLILWAAYPGADDDLSETDERVMSIFGNMDGVATVEEIELNKPLLPVDTQYVEIKGGNHAQFGLYGPQDRDFDAGIPAHVQHQQIVGASLHFIRSIEADNSTTKNPIFDSAPTTEWCLQAQSVIAGLESQTIGQHFDVNPYAQVEQFSESNPDRIGDGTSSFALSAYIREHGNWNRLDAPPILPREIWCKLKSQEFVLDELNMTTTMVETSCKDVNEATIEWAKAQLPSQLQTQLSTIGLSIEYLADDAFETELEWLVDGRVRIENTSTEDQASIQIRSASFKVNGQASTSDADGFPDATRHRVHCKLLAPAEAFRWLMVLTEPTEN